MKKHLLWHFTLLIFAPPFISFGKPIFKWDKNFGNDVRNGRGITSCSRVARTTDGNFLILFQSSEEAGEDKSNAGAGAWLIKITQDGTRIQDKTIRNTSASSVGDIVATPDGESVMAVTLKSFSVTKENTTAVLSWQTTSEKNSDYFEMQHSLDGKDWTELNTINAQRESNGLTAYHYAHTTPVLGEDNFYRLKMVDADGSFAYSRIEKVAFESDLRVVAYPNPASKELRIEGVSAYKIKSVHWYDASGRTVAIKENLGVPNLPSGVYLIRIEQKDGHTSSTKIIVTSK